MFSHPADLIQDFSKVFLPHHKKFSSSPPGKNYAFANEILLFILELNTYNIKSSF